jgi:hypothetical protein
VAGCGCGGASGVSSVADRTGGSGRFIFRFRSYT